MSVSPVDSIKALSYRLGYSDQAGCVLHHTAFQILLGHNNREVGMVRHPSYAVCAWDARLFV